MRTQYVLAMAALIFAPIVSLAADSAPPNITSIALSNGAPRLQFSPAPAIDQYRVQSSTTITNQFSNDLSGILSGFGWNGTNMGGARFFRVQGTPMSGNALLTANVLNRLAYGPTPDDLAGLAGTDPQAYINQQLAPETIPDENIDSDLGSETNWIYVTMTGTNGNNNTTPANFYLSLNNFGSVYVDDVVLVRGDAAEAGTNLLRNGDFEAPLAGTWTTAPNFANSTISTVVRHSGNSSLLLAANTNVAGVNTNNSLFQQFLPSVSNTQVWTFSFWYLPAGNVTNTERGDAVNRVLTVGLANSLAGVNTLMPASPATLFGRLTNTTATLNDLRAWFCLHAVSAKRQLLEVLTQFLENHFVTQHQKTVEYMGTKGYDNALQQRHATVLEFREIMRWRQALLDPNCTFSNLLRISAESPAMIIYLDTVGSRGDGARIANENYARELLELFTCGVDNGYDQNDITVMSRAWTGWSVELVDATNIYNPFALKSTTQIVPGAGNNYSNLVGVWAFNYIPGYHFTNANKLLFPGKTVPARFGPPWAGRSYELNIPKTLPRATNGIDDGYQVISHLCNQPFTEEYLSIKLCRLFVHDNFPNPSNDPTNPDYPFYHYAAGNLSPEAKLVHDCMLAWENSAPKGRIRDVLATIFNSDLFRSHGGSMQKVKTPLELAASTIRALRATKPNGGFTASTDGASFSTPLNRMGTMLLFDRAEPNGYPETGDAWVSSGTLAERIRFTQSTLTAVGQNTGNVKTDGGNNNITDPVTLLKLKTPQGAWTNAATVADYFLGIIFPGEGRGNLDLYRTAAINFLNTGDTGAPSAFSSLPVSATGGSGYDTRVRGMVSMLLSSPRFQEQ